MRRLTLSLLTVAFSSSLYAADQVDVLAQQAPKQALLRHWAEDVLLPLTQDFATAADKLAHVSQAFCSGHRDLGQVQATWRDTQSAWQALEMLQLGPTIERRTQRQVNSWPVRPKLLAPLLTDSSTIDSETIEALGAAGKGLPALEYLLFAENKDKADEARKKSLAAAHCNVLQALAAHVKSEAEGLATDWRAPNGGFARQLAEAGQHPENSPFATSDQALSDVVNLLIAGIDAVKVRKIGKVLEKSSSDGAALERIESWRAGTSLDHIRDNLRGFEKLFFGTGANGIGLDDYLTKIERPGLARIVRQELDAVQQALAAIRPPLQNAVLTQRKQVENLHKALGRLQHLLETEVADALKVDLGFNANDGD